MPRASRTGVRGLYYDPVEKLFRIDFRWRNARTGEMNRHRERLPRATKKPAAQRRAEEVVNLALSGKLHERRGDVPTNLDAAFKRYLEYVKTNLGERAHDDRERHADLWVKHIGNVALVDLSSFQIEGYKSKRKKDVRETPDGEKPPAPATINRELATMKHFLGQAAEWGWIADGHAAKLRKVKMLKEPPGRVRWLSDAERQRLYASLPVEFARVVTAGALSGMRRAELVGLRKEQVDLKRRLIALTKTKSNRTRHVPISDALAAVLKDALACSDGEQPHVFMSRRKVPYTPDGVSSFFRKLVKRAGIEDFHLHDLRHDFATQVRRHGAGLDVVAKLLGHSTLAMSQRYAHLGDDTMRSAVEAIAPALPPAVSETPKKPAKTA